MRVEMILKDIKDDYSRENFVRLKQALEAENMIKGRWKHFEIVFDKAGTLISWPHYLGFQPKDVIQTSLIGAGTVTWNYVLFNKTHLNITVSGACTVRAYIGSHDEEN